MIAEGGSTRSERTPEPAFYSSGCRRLLEKMEIVHRQAMEGVVGRVWWYMGACGADRGRGNGEVGWSRDASTESNNSQGEEELWDELRKARDGLGRSKETRWVREEKNWDRRREEQAAGAESWKRRRRERENRQLGEDGRTRRSWAVAVAVAAAVGALQWQAAGPSVVWQA
jgi:hypothetical protein